MGNIQKTVLLVEDVEDARAMMRLMIEKQGHAVIEAAGAYEAIAKAEEFIPDLILMDVGLPLMDGFSTAQLIKDMYRLEQIPIIAVTAFRDVQEQAERAGCSGVLYKPINMSDLAMILDKHLPSQRPIQTVS